MRNIVITGAQLKNKGAEAMLYTTVDQLRRHYPQHRIVMLLGNIYEVSEEVKNNYKFSILKIGKERLILAGGVIGFCTRLRGYNAVVLKQLREVMDNADYLVDISGYALGSKWPFMRCVHYLLRFRMAEKFGVKSFIFPQSFGPFEYGGIKNAIFTHFVCQNLGRAKKIYAREQEGCLLLKQKYGLENVEMYPDLVLAADEIDYHNIYREIPNMKKCSILSGAAIGILPNVMLMKHGDESRVMNLYEKIIQELLKRNKTVYVFRHAEDDMELCKKIKNVFKEVSNVRLIDEEFDSREFSNLIVAFDFIIASRYHAIVHAYKNSVPVVAFGWAEKYIELLERFQQSQYMFDIGNIEDERILEAVIKMSEVHVEESKTIGRNLQELKMTNQTDIYCLDV